MTDSPAHWGQPPFTPYDKPIWDLQMLLADEPKLQDDLLTSLNRASDQAQAHGIPGINIRSLSDYYDYLRDVVTFMPREGHVYHTIVKFYFLINQVPDLQQNPRFAQWIIDFNEVQGQWLNTQESALQIDSFKDRNKHQPDYHWDDYFDPPSGFKSFNQFFAREVKPGKRPVADLRDDSIVVSPADSVFRGTWSIDNNAKIHAKGGTFDLHKLLHQCGWADHFAGGTFTHAFLNANDYHRYHTPVAGTVRHKEVIKGRNYLNVEIENGALHATDKVGYQFQQARGLLVMDSPIGYVALLPIGMANVSSVNLTPDLGAELHKGEEIGFFLFGGSDFITLYQKGAIREFTAQTPEHDDRTHYPGGRHPNRPKGKYLVGEQIAKAQPR